MTDPEDVLRICAIWVHMDRNEIENDKKIERTIARFFSSMLLFTRILVD